MTTNKLVEISSTGASRNEWNVFASDTDAPDPAREIIEQSSNRSRQEPCV